DKFFAGEGEAGGGDLALVGAVLAPLHLHGVDLHDGEDPLLLDVEVEGGLVARVAVLVVLQPLVQVVGALGQNDLVIQRSDDAGLKHLNSWRPAPASPRGAGGAAKVAPG